MENPKKKKKQQKTPFSNLLIFIPFFFYFLPLSSIVLYSDASDFLNVVPLRLKHKTHTPYVYVV